MNAELECELFAAALDEIGAYGNLINQVLEVSLDTLNSKSVDILCYDLPAMPPGAQ